MAKIKDFLCKIYKKVERYMGKVENERQVYELNLEEEKRREIRKKIEELKEKKEKCEILKRSFTSQKNSLEDIAWQFIKCQKLVVMPPMDSFCGITATSAGQGAVEAQEFMGAKASQIFDVGVAIEVQIGKLSSYVTELDRQINELQYSL